MITNLRCPLHTLPQHASAECTVVFGGALIEFVEVQGMLERTILDQAPLWDIFVRLDQAVRKTKILFGIRVQLLGTKGDDISQAFFGTVFAFHAAGVGRPMKRI